LALVALAQRVKPSTHLAMEDQTAATAVLEAQHSTAGSAVALPQKQPSLRH
jgi:hypothetical protein